MTNRFVPAVRFSRAPSPAFVQTVITEFRGARAPVRAGDDDVLPDGFVFLFNRSGPNGENLQDGRGVGKREPDVLLRVQHNGEREEL